MEQLKKDEAKHILQKTYGILQYAFCDSLPLMTDEEKLYHLNDIKRVIDLINQEL